MGVRYVETDVRQTRDGKLVLMHDQKVDRTTNGEGLVKGLTAPEIRRLDAGKGEKVPLFSEVIEAVKGSGWGFSRRSRSRGRKDGSPPCWSAAGSSAIASRSLSTTGQSSA